VPFADGLGGARWFHLDDNPGTEALYLVTGYERVKNLDGRLIRTRTARGSALSALTTDVADAIDNVRTRSARTGRPPTVSPSQVWARHASPAVPRSGPVSPGKSRTVSSL